MDLCLEPWMMQVVRTIEAEEKWRLEGNYGVEIHPDSLPLCCRIITSYFNDFTEASNLEKERLVKDYMVKLLDVVCLKFICQIQMVAEEDGLDIEYLLHRACIELAEIEKEKDSSTKVWMPHVRKEYADLMGKWHYFEETWKPVLMSQCTPRIGVEELGMLRLLHKELRFYLTNEKATENRDIVSRLFEPLDALRTKIELSIGKDLKQILTVGPSEIEEATREFFWFPALWTSKFLKPRYQNLETRLGKRFTGQENAIRRITNALTQLQYGKGPIRSFLFICRSIDCGDEEELARALAEEVFYDKERLIEFDLSENAEFNWSGVKAELNDAVKKKPYSVVFLQNIDKADASIIDFLLEILRDGRIADEKGGIVDFSRTLIIMKLCVLGCTTFKHLRCDCAYKAAKLPPEPLEDHDCRYSSLLKNAKQCLRADLFGIIDDVIVFEYHPPHDYRAFARHQLRNMASHIGAGRLILYPSEAALGLIVGTYGVNINGKIKTHIEENVAPKLLDICEGGRMIRSTVYLDVLVGTGEISYRVEMGGYLVGNKEYEQFLANFWKLRDVYEREILWLRKINGLRKTLQMIDGTKNTNASVGLDLLADRIEDLLVTETEINTVLWNLQVATASNKFGKLQQIDGSKRVYKKEIMEVLRTKLYTCFADGHYVFDTVRRALLSCIDCCIGSHSQVMVNRPAVFLLLGLTTAGKADLLKDLTKLLLVENGVALIAQINSSECTDFDKFFNLIYTNHKPVGVLLIDQLEMMPMSVFSGLLRMMDCGILSDHRGCTVDLRHNVVILVSDLGNRDTLAQIFGPRSELERKMTGHFESPSKSSWREYHKQPERKRFRSELLNHVEEIVFFNPCVRGGQQMTSFARLPMSDGPHIRQGSPASLSNSLQQLFHEGDNKREPYYSLLAAAAVDEISRGILIVSITERTKD
ncbi:hypothetical protein PTKIN_Ptkin14bG0115100 [Pterospermum kingtungense]